MKCVSVETLNTAAQSPESFIRGSETFYDKQIADAGDKVFEQRGQRPIMLISGPSGSGKTTTAMRFASYLRDKGCKTHTISMDNYFLPLAMNEAARDKDGKIDFESPQRLDIPLFKEHLEKLFRGIEIEIPTFDFAEQDRHPGMPLKRENGDLIVIEGIHALNPLLTGDCEEYTQCVYVSVRTRIQSGSEQLHPSKIRLMRRLIRDKLYRGRDIAETFEFFKSVERGENLYIMPYKNRADFDIDTFIDYEAPVYRDILLPELRKAAPRYADYGNFSDIERFLTRLKPIDRDFVPKDALIREFIG